ncbi:MAG: hypothetical protein AAF741_13645 [Bacteroidota bacterium]
MKTFLQSGLLALFLLCAYGPLAAHTLQDDGGDPMNMKTEVDGMDLNLRLTNLQQETTFVNLSTIDGDEVFFTERIAKHNGYAVGLQLDDLPDGRYLLTVKKGDTVKHQVVVIENGDLLLSDIS